MHILLGHVTHSISYACAFSLPLVSMFVDLRFVPHALETLSLVWS